MPSDGALVVIQARMSSTRLPGKVLADVCGEPMLGLLLRRLERSEQTQEVRIATSVEPLDDPIEEVAAERGIRCHRGPRDDVLARYVGAIGDHDGTVVRITGDCPLTDPAVVDAALRLFATTTGCRYVQNVEPRTFPDGLDVEVFDAAALRELAGEAQDPYDREHVTSALRRDRNRFPAATLPGAEQYAEVRWTVDTPDDLDFIRLVAERLGDQRYEAGMDAILDAVRADPSLASHGGWRRA
jgi:spore coat polysaccharide biosynthesis protein SpsF (cytidylyltransferase family)